MPHVARCCGTLLRHAAAGYPPEERAGCESEHRCHHHRTGGGTFDRVTDEAVAYDAKTNAWLISSLVLSEAGGVKGVEIFTSRSTDGGFTWGTPVLTENSSSSPDKNWIVCDDTATSPFYGHCYTEWDDNGAGNLLHMSTSPDGGQSWGAALTNNAGVIGGQPGCGPVHQCR